MKSTWRGYKIKGKKGFSKQDDKNVIFDEKKVVACPDGTTPNDMEEGVSEKNMTRIKYFMR